MDAGIYQKNASIVLNEICQTVQSIENNQTMMLIDDICEAEKVFLIGVGRVMLSLQAFCKRLFHLGVDIHCVGDITEPAITSKDILIVASGSGESIVPVAIAEKAREIGCKRIIHIGSNQYGRMSKYADYMIKIPTQTRLYLPGEIKSKQIMTSLFEQTLFIYGDIIAMIIAEKKEIDLSTLWAFHANLE